MASSSFYSGSSQDATNVNAVEDSKNAAALSETAAAASATAAAGSATAAAGSATTAATKASESASSATASATSASASQVSRVASEAAKVASETAKTAAETARDAAAASSTSASSSQNAAATSAATAATEASNSATSASASEASNVAAGVAKVAAETAETAAQTAQAAAEAAEAATEALFDQFGDQYLGPKASDPTVDNDGSPLAEGAVYFNTTDDVLKFYSGSAWVAPESVASTAAAAAQAAQAAAETAEANAETAEVNAETAEANAASSAAAAANSASAASTSEANADTSEANALTYSSNAATSAAAAASSAAGIAGYDLDVIAETKGVTATDVFVYDTSKDSDGGAWRKRTQGTSWYNETLNTATRGSRREFPAVAVIVAEATKVTIYDGDDPSLPMWMVFNIGSNYMFGGNPTISTAHASSGIIATSNRSSGGGVYYADLLKDYGYNYQTGGLYTKLLNVSERNTTGTHTLLNSSVGIVNNIINDVAMTVLPNAPIDAATGLPVPTIAVATDGGVSVIKDDGTVVDSAATAAQGVVAWLDDGLIYADAASVYSLFWATNTDIATGDGFGDQVATSTTLDDFAMPAAPEAIAGFGSEFILGNNSTTFGVVKKGVARFAFNSSALGSTMSALLTSTYNTGWMNGDIKGAFLSDTDDTDLVGGVELVTNGTFDDGLTGWTNTSGAWSASGGLASVTTTTGVADLNINVPTTVGKTYLITADVTVTAGSILIRRVSPSTATAYSSVSGQLSIAFVAGSTSTPIGTRANTNTQATIDNISVKLIDADRSVNANGLAINGTVTRTPVATGADLVAYSGFSASNYLEQPYNSDLDFGTGDFCVMGWVTKSTNTYRGLLTLWNVAGTAGFKLQGGGNSDGIGIQPVSGAGLSFRGLSSTEFSLVCFVRRSGVIYGYLNGELKGSVANTTDISTLDGSLIIGHLASEPNFAWQGKLSLLRISATAPTAEQIAKIYNDEKVLFQENAQATLYGTSDAVTALAHDDATNLLHVGTSAGRSVFQGLRRVDNTTTAVGTAISASNNMIVEE